MVETYFQDGARHIPWKDIDPKGPAPAKIIDGRYMSEEEYDVVGFRFEGTYPVAHPHRPGCLRPPAEVPIWRAPYSGLVRWGQMKQQRKEERRSSWQARVEREEEMSEYVNGLLDAAEEEKP